MDIYNFEVVIKSLIVVFVRIFIYYFNDMPNIHFTVYFDFKENFEYNDVCLMFSISKGCQPLL